MSAALGYYHIEFLKRDESPDVDTAQEAFKWCQDEYDWFDKVNITLKDHYIIGDGLHVKDTDIPHEKNSIEDWIRDIGTEVDAELILASVLIDVSESDDNDKYHLVYKNGELETENYKYNKHLCGIVLASGEYLVCDLGYYDKYIYRGLFRNKKTGVEMNLGYLLIDDSGFYRFCGDNIDGAPAAYVCNDEGETVKAPDEDIYNYSCFGIKDDEGSVSNVTPCEVLSSWQIKTDSDEILDVSEWEFVGFNACGMNDLVHRTRTKDCSPTVVVIPEGTTTIEYEAFKDCTGLTSVTIPDSVTSIRQWTFAGCEGLTSVTIPDSVTEIGEGAFADCEGLTSVTIPDSVTEIGEGAFAGCEGLTSVTISDSVTEIGEKAFWCCEGLTSITIPDGVTSIGEEAFSDCKGLTSVTIPDSVTEIGSSAFSRTGLTSVTILDGVTSIGSSAFLGCARLTSVTIPDSVTSIGRNAFEGCTGLTSIIIPDSVTEIGDWAFGRCNITSLDHPCLKIENGLAIKDSKVLYCASQSTSVTIPDGITEIVDKAFYGCEGLTSVTIPDSVTEIGDWAFRGCNITSLDHPCLKIENGLAIKDGVVLYYNSQSASVIIPDGVTSIGSWAFSGCEGLTSVTIPDGVTEIGEWVFYGCTGLTSVTIPDGVTSIGESAFMGCFGLTSVTIPDSVTSIGSHAFSCCYGLTSVTIPDSVTSIGEDPFEDCPLDEATRARIKEITG